MQVDTMEAAEGDEIFLGKSFGSFEELEQFISTFERDHRQKFWIRSSRSVEAARKILKRPLSQNIRYYELQYSCIHGGLEFKTRGKGIRNMSTHKMNCPAKIKLRATPDGNRLEVRSFVATHEGHPFSEGVFDHLPQNRRKQRGRKLRKFLTVDYARGKKRKLPVHLLSTVDDADDGNGEGATVDEEILKEFFITDSQDEINKSLLLLRDDYGANTTVLYDDENKLKALYFYTPDMKKSLFAWPETIYIWGIHNWLSRNYTVMLISIKDSNGMNEVVGIGILSFEDKDALAWFLHTFRNVFPPDEPIPIKCIFSYKSLVENELQSEFHDVPCRVSIYYSTKLFNKIITSDTFIVTNKEREICTKLFSKMVYNKTFDEFKVIYSLFCKVAPSFVVEYFNQDWEPFKDLWALHNFPPYSFVDSNKNAKDCSLDNRFKQVVPKDSTILTVIKQLLRWLETLRCEMKKKASEHILKISANSIEKGTWQDLYSHYLTHYACNYVGQQVSSSFNMKVLGETEDGCYVVQEETNCFSVTVDSCPCIDSTSMRLPCRHIIRLRDHVGIMFFEDSLCHERWTKSYYLDHRLDMESSDGCALRPCKDVRRYQVDPAARVVNLANQLVHHVLNDGRTEERLKILDKIASSWSAGYEVDVVTDGHELVLEEQQVVEESCELYDHDPESAEILDETILIQEEVAPNDEAAIPAAIIKMEVPDANEEEVVVEEEEEEEDASFADETTIIAEKPEAKNISKASVLMKFDVTKYNKQLNPLKFSQKKEEEKLQMILSWISKSPELMQEALNENYVLNKVDIELQPENIQHSILHESVNLDILENYLEPVALSELKSCVQQKRIHEVWQCFVCELQLDDDCVLCCSCLLWFHPKCVGLPSPQKRKLWFCYNCHIKCTPC